MAALLSGSTGLNDHYYFNGALVYIKSQRSLGYVIKPIDVENDISVCRFNIWTNRDRFGTFLDDIQILQLITGSFYKCIT